MKLEEIQLPKIELLKVYSCPTCYKAFWEDPDEDYDWMDAQSDARDCCEPERSYGCPVCKETFYPREQGENHLKQADHMVVAKDPTPTELYLDGLRFSNKSVVQLQNELLECTSEMENA